MSAPLKNCFARNILQTNLPNLLPNLFQNLLWHLFRNLLQNLLRNWFRTTRKLDRHRVNTFTRSERVSDQQTIPRIRRLCGNEEPTSVNGGK